MEKKLYMYEAVISPSSIGGFEVEIPDLDAVTQGDDLHDAALMGQGLIKTVVSHLLEGGEPVPAATFGRRPPEGGFVMAIATEAPEPAAAEMSAEDAASILGVSRARVYAMVRDGVLDGRKVGQSVLVSAASVRERQGTPHGAGRPRRAKAAV